jgi:hypothetical protein
MKKIAALLLTMMIFMSMCACKETKPAYSSSTASDISGEEFQQLIDAAKNSASPTPGQS